VSPVLKAVAKARSDKLDWAKKLDDGKLAMEKSGNGECILIL